MPQENVEVVLGIHAAFSRGDLEGFLALWDPAAEYRAAITDAIEGEAGAFRGHDGLRRWWAELDDLYVDLSTEVVEVRDAGEQVAVGFIIRGRGRGSGLADEQPLGQVVRVREGKVVEARDYFNREDAFAAIGPE
jgi:ketosteroid isomerase-like protein